MPEEPKIVRISDLPRAKAEGFISAYANHTEALPGFYDIRLVFSQIASDTPGQPTITEHAGIAMSWEHAARVRDLLARLVEAYEKENGPIRSQQDAATTQTEVEPSVPIE